MFIKDCTLSEFALKELLMKCDRNIIIEEDEEEDYDDDYRFHCKHPPILLLV